jgi:magnesium-transporting ATPase (P-type)
VFDFDNEEDRCTLIQKLRDFPRRIYAAFDLQLKDFEKQDWIEEMKRIKPSRMIKELKPQILKILNRKFLEESPKLHYYPDIVRFFLKYPGICRTEVLVDSGKMAIELGTKEDRYGDNFVSRKGRVGPIFSFIGQLWKSLWDHRYFIGFLIIQLIGSVSYEFDGIYHSATTLFLVFSIVFTAVVRTNAQFQYDKPFNNENQRRVLVRDSDAADGKVWAKEPCSDLQIGSIIRISRRKEIPRTDNSMQLDFSETESPTDTSEQDTGIIPVDMVILAASQEKFSVCNQNIFGSTILADKATPVTFNSMDLRSTLEDDSKISDVKFLIEGQGGVYNQYKGGFFVSSLDLSLALNEESRISPLYESNFLLKGSKLVNADWVFGLVVSVGLQGKMLKKTDTAPLKKSNLQAVTDTALWRIFLTQVFLSIFAALLQVVWLNEKTHEEQLEAYLGVGPSQSKLFIE